MVSEVVHRLSLLRLSLGDGTMMEKRLEWLENENR
jgi:hypothetical protein